MNIPMYSALSMLVHGKALYKNIIIIIIIIMNPTTNMWGLTTVRSCGHLSNLYNSVQHSGHSSLTHYTGDI